MSPGCGLLSRIRERRLPVCRRHHEIGDARHDFRLEARAVEDAVMADALLHIMHPAVIGNRTAQRVRRFGLPKSGNVVVLAFHRHQRDASHLRRVDRFAAVVISPFGNACRMKTVSTVCK